MLVPLSHRYLVKSLVIGIILGIILPVGNRRIQCATGLRIKLSNDYYRYQDVNKKDRFINSYSVQAFYPFGDETGWKLRGTSDFREGNSGTPGKEGFRLIDLYIDGPLGNSLWSPHLFIGRLPFYLSPSGAIDGIMGEWKTRRGKIFLGGGKQVYHLYRMDRNEIPKRWSLTSGWDYRLGDNGILSLGKWGKAQLSGLSLSHLVTWRQLNTAKNFPQKDQSPLDLNESQGRVWGTVGSVNIVSDISYDWLNNNLRVWETRLHQRKDNLSLSIYHRLQQWRIYQTDSLIRLPLEPVHITGLRVIRHLPLSNINLTGESSVR
ncbi:MAG: hypothetical protein ACK4OO_07725, partial [bacterium]